IRTFSGHTGPVNSVAYSPDGTKVLTGGSDRTARLWDISDFVPTPTPTPASTNTPTRTPGNTPTPHPGGEPVTINLPGLPSDAVPLEFVQIPAGTFLMGSPAGEKGGNPDERPRHEVTILNDFYMGKHEVTNAQFRAFRPSHDSKNVYTWSLNDDNQPVVRVSWRSAEAFCEWLSIQSGTCVRLPKEAEWEYACRAGTTTRRYWGDDLSEDMACGYANVRDILANTWLSQVDPEWIADQPFFSCDDGHVAAAPVGSFQPNAFGLHDMLGNVWEWCLDVYAGYTSGAAVSPKGREPRSYRSIHTRSSATAIEPMMVNDYTGSGWIMRGGSWSSVPQSVRSAYRGAAEREGYANHHLGFRVAVSAWTPPTEPDIVYEFDKANLAEDDWSEIAGGFTGAATATVLVAPLVNNEIPSSEDRKGLAITVEPGEVAFLLNQYGIETNGFPVLLVSTVRAEDPSAAVALAALSGNWGGSIATNIPSAANLVEKEGKIALLYEPEYSEAFIPILQVAPTGQTNPVTVYVDKVEVFQLDSGLSPLLSVGANSTYEFDQPDMSSGAWAEIPGGFTGQQPGTISPVDLTEDSIPSSRDNKGFDFAVNPGEVALIYAREPVETGGFPVLMRLTYRANKWNASLILGALKGDLTTGTNLDWSLATQEIADVWGSTQEERRIVFLYEPGTCETFTPLIQVMGKESSSSVRLQIDRLEVFRLTADAFPSAWTFRSGESSPTPTPMVTPTPTPSPAQPVLVPIPIDRQIIVTVAGDGNGRFSGDGGKATSASLYYPNRLYVDDDGILFIADTHNNRIRRVGTDGIISTVAGGGANSPQDGAMAVNVAFGKIGAILGAKNKTLCFCDQDNHRIYAMSPDGKIGAIAGVGRAGFSGDGGPALNAELNTPVDLALSGDERFLFAAEFFSNKVRKIDLASGTIDSLPMDLNQPSGLCFFSGCVYVADALNNRVVRFDLSSGQIATVAGNGSRSFSGDGGPATSAALNIPRGVHFDHQGHMYIVDQWNQRIRKVDKNTGIISTVVGNGAKSFGGDGGNPTQASLDWPGYVWIDLFGNLYITDTYNHRVRRVMLYEVSPGSG
ncbi:MAG: SUMF1/EgtB/PvdO family nonheme iron enzyme, partial [bacterium]